jgi:hypothetical protein
MFVFTSDNLQHVVVLHGLLLMLYVGFGVKASTLLVDRTIDLYVSQVNLQSRDFLLGSRWSPMSMNFTPPLPPNTLPAKLMYGRPPLA